MRKREESVRSRRRVGIVIALVNEMLREFAKGRMVCIFCGLYFRHYKKNRG